MELQTNCRALEAKMENNAAIFQLNHFINRRIHSVVFKNTISATLYNEYQIMSLFE